MEYPAVVSELAYEMLLSKDMILDAQDLAAAKKYGEALVLYLAAKDIWETGQDYHNCISEYHLSTEWCKGKYGDSARREASIAGLNPDDILRDYDNALRSVWQAAEERAGAAEKIRHGASAPAPRN